MESMTSWPSRSQPPCVGRPKPVQLAVCQDSHPNGLSACAEVIHEDCQPLRLLFLPFDYLAVPANKPIIHLFGWHQVNSMLVEGKSQILVECASGGPNLDEFVTPSLSGECSQMPVFQA